jgi:hypothetical protein
MQKNQMVFIGKRGCSISHEHYDPEKWEGNYYYAITLRDLLRFKSNFLAYETGKSDIEPSLESYIKYEGGHLQSMELSYVLRLSYFTNKELRAFFDTI